MSSSPPSELCLSVDLGTGGPKVALVSPSGEIVAHDVQRVATHFDDSGAATQDAAQWWTLICAATRRLLSDVDGPTSRVRAVAVTGQYASTVPVDATGRPTGPCLTWRDTRGGAYARATVGGRFMGYNVRTALAFLRISGGAPSISGADPIGQMLYLYHEQRDVLAATRWFMEPVDYLTMRFSGVASATHASRLASWLTDNRRLTLYEYDTRLARRVGVDVTRLAPLVPFGSVVGELCAAAVAETGLAPGTIVVTGIPDLHAAALGSGATALFETHLALSTTSWISCPVAKKKTDVLHSIAAVPGLTNDSYVVANNQETGAGALEWLRGVLSIDGSPMRFNEMTSLAGTSPPGANGVSFTPWLAGERSPRENKSVRAGFSNLSVTTNRADVIRAVMEGVGAYSAWLLGHVEKFVGRPLSPIRLLGGGAQSTLWCQIFADALNREVIQVPEPLLAQLRGVARLAFAALEGRPIGRDKANDNGVRFTPDPSAVPLAYARIAALSRSFNQGAAHLRRSEPANS